jgi:hypothetical protein
MAKIQEELVVIRLSRLVKDDQKLSATITGEDFIPSMEAVVAELAGAGVLVEVERAPTE